MAGGVEQKIVQLMQEIDQLKARVKKLERTVQIKEEQEEPEQGEINKKSHNRQNIATSSQRHRSIVERSDITDETRPTERARHLLQAAQAQRDKARGQITDEPGSPKLARTQLQAAQRPNWAARTQRNEIKDEITDDSGSPRLARTEPQVVGRSN